MSERFWTGDLYSWSRLDNGQVAWVKEEPSAFTRGSVRTMQPGSVEGLQMVVSDVKAVRDELVKRGAEMSAIEVMPWGSFAYFSDPDGNRWALQQLPTRE